MSFSNSEAHVRPEILSVRMFFDGKAAMLNVDEEGGDHQVHFGRAEGSVEV